MFRSKNGRRKSMLGKNVVYLVSSESDVDSDQEADNEKKSSSGSDDFLMLDLILTMWLASCNSI